MKKLDLNSIKISLIIPTLNAAEYMPGLIDILGRQSRKPDEIIVIDSESEDATVRMAEQAGFRTLKVKRSEFDHGGTRNYAVAMSKGDVVMFCRRMHCLQMNTMWRICWQALKRRCRHDISQTAPKKGCKAG